ncbi:hypothetical protein OSH08_05665 [Kaistia geumhonensis]|uniref:Phosphohydrolase n=1 Tax=Kaistia geumhonensis TaxID=410839 RepID=A0ABU0M5T6_9HYPH|nr:hypothetical protein [Kaistia geumhonensis]MCX5478481.1 hypothetical protein [Kaistia geumhonensis]MDQ0516301.1 hypothetical protein [Kaistia geumhonensis]
MTAPWLQTASGRAFDLIDPKAENVDFAVDIPEALARIPRFTGHAGAYSVAQHCVLGADLLFAETGRPDYAAAFLLHDAHEAYLGDIATPIAEALAIVSVERLLSPSEDGFREAIRTLKARIDAAIHRAAGIAFPLPLETSRVVKDWDARMLMTERAHLMAKPPAPWAMEDLQPIKVRGAIKAWPWPRPADEYRARLRRWCPAALGEG